jgi:MFS family permease
MTSNTATIEARPLSDAETATEDAVFKKLTWRILPFLFLCFFAAYLDRVNVGFAKAAMSSDLKFSDTAYGIGAGIFFLGYFLFEVPSNLLMHRIGARRTLQRIMLLWGVTSSVMMFVNSELTFYILRFLLGAFEAGFLPGVVLYFTYWYPSHRRGRIIALLISGVAISGLIGAPLSGAILSFTDGAAGLAGWQWMFLLEGVPAIVLSFLVFRILADKPDDATWLTPQEKTCVRLALANDAERTAQTHHYFGAALRDFRVYALCCIYFTTASGAYLISFWLPTLIKKLTIGSGIAPWQLGFIIAIPYLCAAVSMVLMAAHSDRTGERRWHIVLSGLVGVAALLLTTQVSSLFAAVALFSVATSAILSMSPLFWTLPTKLLTGVAAAGGIALINSVGNLAGFVSPIMVGVISDATGSLTGGLWAISGLLVVGCVLVLSVVRDGGGREAASPGVSGVVERS